MEQIGASERESPCKHGCLCHGNSQAGLTGLSCARDVKCRAMINAHEPGAGWRAHRTTRDGGIEQVKRVVVEDALGEEVRRMLAVARQQTQL